MVRAFFVLAAAAAVALALLPFQWVAVRCGSSMRWRISKLFHGFVCGLLGVRIAVRGKRVKTRPLLIVANHVSWLDIVVINAVAPVVFVAKGEVAQWPVIGYLAKLHGTIFVDRTRRSKTRDVNGEIAKRLAEGDPVVLFAEGTSSDGSRVLPFRTALIGAARDALAEAGEPDEVWIQPLSIAYTRLLGLPLMRGDRSTVAWYGSAPLWPHLRLLVARGAIDVAVTWGEPVAFDALSDRKAVARLLEAEARALTVAALRGRAAQAFR